MKIEVIDSHTGGEPTRVVISGWPEVAGSTMKEKLQFAEQNHNHIRKAVVCEPRGHDAIVGALITPPVNEGSVCGAIYFNDAGYLGMCGHATIGLAETLRFTGQLQAGESSIDTPAGTVKVIVAADGSITLRNITPRVLYTDLELAIPGIGLCIGDIVYGGNWFYLVSNLSLELELINMDQLMKITKEIRAALAAKGIVGDDGHKIDHIELFGSPENKRAHSRNFVLCPGNAYDRSPCGTGSSAKMFSLYKRGLLQVGEPWVQESITGSIFDCRLEFEGNSVVPVITSKAFVTSSATLYFNELDPFCWGID